MNWNPFSGTMDRMRAHPIQSIVGMGAGMINPLLGQGVRMGFNALNDHQFAGNMAGANQGLVDRGNAAGQQAMDKPLNGPLGEVQGGRSDNNQLAQALMGSQGMNGPGGSQSGYNMSQNWGQSHPSNGLMDFLGPVQNQQQGSFFTDPQYDPSASSGNKHRDRVDGGMNPNFALHGVSNFMVGGNPVINGTNGGLGGNQAVMARRNRW